MKTFVVWMKFNFVGLIGVVIQLCALALFNRLFRGHYLLATIAAIELTLLHNFVWHIRFTWRDVHGPVLSRLLRFHLLNGLVSLLGNLILMRLLVTLAHLPVLSANAVAIVCCSLVNFFVGHQWIFKASQSPKDTTQDDKSVSGAKEVKKTKCSLCTLYPIVS